MIWLRKLFMWCVISMCSGIWAMEHTPIDKESTELPKTYQQQLTTKGHELLSSIMQGKTFTHLQALPIIQAIPQEIKQKTAFNPLGEYSPLGFARYYLCKENLNFQEYLAKIICVGWALNDLAIQQGEGFERGSFTIIDPYSRLHSFFKNYVCIVNGFTLMDYLPWTLTPSNLAYRRDPASKGSSHHIDQTDGSQFGIDIRFRSHETLYGLLPCQMGHILFGQLRVGTSTNSAELPLTFIKFEATGLGSSLEVTHHLISYLKPVSSLDGKRREKDIPDEIWQNFTNFTYYEFDQTRLKIHEILNHYDIRGYPDRLEEMKTLIKKHFPKDSDELMYIRTGSEVILDLREYPYEKK